MLNLSVGSLTKNTFKFSGIALLYGALTHLGFSLPPEQHAEAQPVVWFAGGIGMLVLLLGSKRFWPLLAIGWLIDFQFRGSNLPITNQIMLGFGIALSCLACVTFLEKMNFNRAIIEVRDVVLLLAGTVIMALCMAVVAMVARGQTGVMLFPWSMGNLAGIVLVVPVVLAWRYGGKFGDRKRWLHFAACVLSAVALCAVAASQVVTVRPFHFFPVLVWAALAFNVRGMAVVSTLIGTVSYFATTTLSGDARQEAIDYVQQSIVLSGFTLLVLAAIADHRRENLRLADREQRLDAIFSTADDGILVVESATGLIDSMNPAAERMFGYETDQWKGTLASDVLFPAGRETLHQAIDENKPIIVRRRDQSEFAAQVTRSVWKNREGETFNTKIVRDLTATNRAAAELIDREERYRAIVETAVDGIIVIDADNIIQSFNVAADRMFGFEIGDAIGQHVSILMHGEDAIAHEAGTRRHAATGEKTVLGTAGVRVNARRKDGSSFPAHLAIAEWFVGGERFYTGIMRDLSEQVASDEARDILAREVDHRAKNALAVVQSLVKLTRASTVRQFIEAVSGRIEALSRAHSLLSQSNWSGAQLSQIVNDELAVAAKGGDVRVDGPSIRVEADSVQPISMVIHELATNAFKYGALSSPNGKVEVTWKIVEGNLVLLWCEKGGPATTEPEQFGFGARMLKQVVTKQINGELDYDWRPEGLSVTITMPSSIFKRSQASKSVSIPPTTEIPEDGAGRRVLIVEDNALISMELETTLEEGGYAIVGRANSVTEAHALITTGAEIDLVVLDIDLNGEYSFPIADLLIEKNIPFTFASGFETMAKDNGYTAPVLRKPVNGNTLKLTLDELSKKK